jgi:hypothetical protein
MWRRLASWSVSAVLGAALAAAPFSSRAADSTSPGLTLAPAIAILGPDSHSVGFLLINHGPRPQPDWIVMRPWEFEELRNRFPAIAANYKVEKVFEMRGIPEAQLNVSGSSGVTFGSMT